MSFEVRRLMQEMHRVHVEMASRIDGVRVLLLGLWSYLCRAGAGEGGAMARQRQRQRQQFFLWFPTCEVNLLLHQKDLGCPICAATGVSQLSSCLSKVTRFPMPEDPRGCLTCYVQRLGRVRRLAFS
jgi:hypothetical protein